MCSMPSRPKDNSDLNGNAKDTVRSFRPGLLGLKKVHFQTFANIHKNLFNWCSHALAFHLELSQLTYWVFCDSFKLSFYLWQIDGNGMCSHVRLFWAFGRCRGHLAWRTSTKTKILILLSIAENKMSCPSSFPDGHLPIFEEENQP